MCSKVISWIIEERLLYKHQETRANERRKRKVRYRAYRV